MSEFIYKCYVMNLVQVLSVSYFIAYVQCLAHRLTHTMVLHREEHGVEDDAQSDEQVEQGVPHHLVQPALEPQPPVVVHTALRALVTIPVRQVICNTIIN